jgi:hypothetical protein
MDGAVAESSSSAIPALPGLDVESVEWLPSGAESGLVRVRGRWVDESARQAELPVLALRAGGLEHRFESLPDARFSRDPSSWRGTYLVPADLVAAGEPEALWLEWASGARSGLPVLARGLEPPPVPGAPARPVEPEDAGGEVIDRAVLAERRARRAEAAERRQARVAAEALKAVEVLELRSAELERRLEEATAERDALAARESDADERRGALSAALASAADLRSRSREWQLRLRTSEITRAGDAVRLAVLEAERATTAPALRAALDEANDAAVAARAELAESGGRFAEAREAWDRRRIELEQQLSQVRADLDRARALESAVAAAEARLRVEAVARTALEDELDRERAARAATIAELDAARADAADADDLRAELEATRAEASTADGLRAALEAARAEASTADGLRAELEAARAERDAARAEAAAAAGELAAGRAALHDLRAELDAARAEAAAGRSVIDGLRAELETARGVVLAGRQALDDLRTELEAERAARREAEGLHARIAELEASGREQLERLAREQAAAAAAREPAADATRLVADLDAAAEALRSRPAAEPVAPDADAAVESAPWPEAAAPVEPATEPVGDRPDTAQAESWAPAVPPVEPAAPDAEPTVEWSASAGEPAAPDAEPAVEWSEPLESGREDVVPAVERRRSGAQQADVEWAPPGFPGSGEAVEPPAPDAEPYVEWAPPQTPPPAHDADESSPPAAAPPAGETSPAEVAPPAEPAGLWSSSAVVAAPAETSPVPDVAPVPAGPKVIPAAKPPARGLMIGTDRRDYPLLRGAVVKLAHDDPALAGRLLAALLPAQGAAIERPLGYDLTIAGLGTYAVGIAAGRATVVSLDAPRGRPDAEFHLTADPLILAELLAGVDHRIGRFFGPARVRGRKRRVKALAPLRTTTATLADAARAGAALDPELVYRAFAYAVHPSWTRGHTFTVAQQVEGDPPETWYLTANDGAGLTVSKTPPDAAPVATVEMSRETFSHILREDTVPPGRRPCIRGDRGAVALMHGWTQRARANG